MTQTQTRHSIFRFAAGIMGALAWLWIVTPLVFDIRRDVGIYILPIMATHHIGLVLFTLLCWWLADRRWPL